MPRAFSEENRKEDRLKLYTIEEVADILGTDRHLVYLLRDYGLLPMAKLGRGWKTTEAELEKFIQWSLGRQLSNEDEIRYEVKRKTLTS